MHSSPALFSFFVAQFLFTSTSSISNDLGRPILEIYCMILYLHINNTVYRNINASLIPHLLVLKYTASVKVGEDEQSLKKFLHRTGTARLSTAMNNEERQPGLLCSFERVSSV